MNCWPNCISSCKSWKHALHCISVTFCVSLGIVGCSKQDPIASTNRISKADVSARQPTEHDPEKLPATPAADLHHGVTFYSVDHYDDSRDARSDLAATVLRASQEKKRILIQVGGDWCGWCLRMSEFMETNEVVRDILTKKFVVMKVNYSNKQTNEAFLAQFPNISAYPHLFVLEGDGTFLFSQGTGELEQGKGYHEAVYQKFLISWQLEP